MVYELGEGPVVLLCHGFPAIAASWRFQMEGLTSAGYRALAPDMRGYGFSDAPDDADLYTNFHIVGDLVSILNHLKVSECVVIGHDFGASVAWSAALMRPDRFRAVFGLSVAFLPLGGPSFLDKLRAAGRMDFYMVEQMKPEADAAWRNASATMRAFTIGPPVEHPPKEGGTLSTRHLGCFENLQRHSPSILR